MNWDRVFMFIKVKAMIGAAKLWLMTPVVKAKEVRQRLVFRALRSRFFCLVALLTSVPVLMEALGATYKAVRPKGDVTPWLLWAVAIVTWIFFILTLISEWQGIKNRMQKERRSTGA